MTRIHIRCVAIVCLTTPAPLKGIEVRTSSQCAYTTSCPSSAQITYTREFSITVSVPKYATTQPPPSLTLFSQANSSLGPFLPDPWVSVFRCCAASWTGGNQKRRRLAAYSPRDQGSMSEQIANIRASWRGGRKGRKGAACRTRHKYDTAHTIPFNAQRPCHPAIPSP